MSASRTTKSFTAHPAFPVIVALWFAALLGLGTLVVPPANFEALVVATGLDRLVPAAAPPLGDTARLAISASAALLGALLGLAIAARIRRSHDEPQFRTEEAETGSESPWLADDESITVAAAAEEEPANETESAAGDAAGIVPSRLARRFSVSERDGPPPEEAAGDTGEEVARIFEASELRPADPADNQPDNSKITATPSGGDDDDLERFAADRLVAGLPRVERRNFDEDPLEDWSQPERLDEVPAGEPECAATPEPAATDLQEPEEVEPNFDPSEPVEDAEYEELSVENPHTQEWESAASDTPSEPSWDTDAAWEGERETAPLDLPGSSLAELVARFDAALAAHRARSPSKTAAPPADPVIAFLRREAERDRGGAGEALEEQSGDPRAGLRNALDKLDRVSRKS